MKNVLFLSVVFILAGCSSQKDTVRAVQQGTNPAKITTPGGTAENTSAVRIRECKNELAALKEFNVRAYDKYQAEYDSISRETQKYIKVKSQLGEDINYLAMPKFQFAIRNVCFRIKNDLTSSIVDQVK